LVPISYGTGTGILSQVVCYGRLAATLALRQLDPVSWLLYIISDLLIWSAYFAIPLIILNYVLPEAGAQFTMLLPVT